MTRAEIIDYNLSLEQENDLLQEGWELGRRLQSEYLPGAILLGIDPEGVLLARGVSERTQIPWGRILVEEVVSESGELLGALTEGVSPLWTGERDGERAMAAGIALREKSRALHHYRLPPLAGRPVVVVSESGDLRAEVAALRARSLFAAEVYGLFLEPGDFEHSFQRLFPEE